MTTANVHTGNSFREGGRVQDIVTLSALPKYTFNAKELDEETGMYYYEARYYKPPVFTSRDPMFEKYFWMTPYAYCANNPVKYVDPDGRWIPGLDEENNVVVTMEENDDFNSFKVFMGKGYCDEDLQKMYSTLQDGKINLTKEYGGIFQEMTNVINSGYTIGVNCWGTAISILDNNRIDPNYKYERHGIDNGMNADIKLRLTGCSVPQSEASVGSTLIRFSDDRNPTWYGSTDHFATYMGTDSKGNQYCFTKNGWKCNWDIQKIDDFHFPGTEIKITSYGSPAPLMNDMYPYYNKR